MKPHNQKSPNLAETGNSENIHLSKANEYYINMILNNPQCLKFCCDVLDQFDCLLNRFSPTNPKVYQGNEVCAFIALNNLQKLVDSEHNKTY